MSAEAIQLFTVEEYLELEQSSVEHFARAIDDRWIWSIYEGLESSVSLPSLNIVLHLADIYQSIEFAQDTK